MNQSTIKNFIGKAFNTIDLKPGMIKMETKNQEDGKLKNQIKRKATKKNKLKLRPQESEVVSAASFLTNSDNEQDKQSEPSLATDKSFNSMTQLGSEYTQSEQLKYENKKNRLMEKKAIRAKNYIKYVQSTREGRLKIYKEILKHDYTKFFVEGFELKVIDEKLQHLPSSEKTKVIDYVLSALNQDLKTFSSQDRNKRLEEIKSPAKNKSSKADKEFEEWEAEDKKPMLLMSQRKMNNWKIEPDPIEGEINLLSDDSSEDDEEKRQVKRTLKLMKIMKKIRDELHGNDLDNVENYNPFATTLNPNQLKRNKIEVSESVIQRPADQSLHIGGEQLRKMSRAETKKNRKQNIANGSK